MYTSSIELSTVARLMVSMLCRPGWTLMLRLRAGTKLERETRTA